jgi:hypothetical protein
MMSHLKTLEAKAPAWSNVSIRPHPFGGREFRFGDAEVGHVHPGGIVDTPFHARCVMHSWQKGWPSSTPGFRTQDGPHFKYAARKASAMLSGSCDCHFSATL